MARILVTRHLPEGGLSPLDGHDLVIRKHDIPYTKEELLDAVADVEAIICVLSDKIDAEIIAAAPNLKIISTVAVGFDNIDVAAAAANNIYVCNTPGILDETTADLAWFLILAASRLTSTAERDLRAGEWHGWGINQYLGHDVHAATLGIVGYGRIGRAVAKRAQGFNMTVLHHSRNDTRMPGYIEDLDDLLSRSDVVSLHIPYTPESHHLINSARLAKMKHSAVLVNTSRGLVVDEEALANALEDSWIFAAGLDVYEREPEIHSLLLTAPRTVLLPHIGSASLETRRRMSMLASEAVRITLSGGSPRNTVSVAKS